jgi:transposase
LWAEAVNRLHEDPLQGAIFAFTNRDRDRLKLLYWDGSGVVVVAKRLEQGRFSWIVRPGESKVQLTAEALAMIISGIDLKKTEKKAWYRRNSA